MFKKSLLLAPLGDLTTTQRPEYSIIRMSKLRHCHPIYIIDFSTVLLLLQS